MLVRAVGPTLATFDVPGPLPDPFLTIWQGSLPIHFNDNWSERPDANEIEQAAVAVGAFPLPPASKDAALLVELPPGTYTAGVVSKSGNDAGAALVEIYVMP